MDQNKRAVYRAFSRSVQAREAQNEERMMRLYAAVGAAITVVLVVLLILALSGVQPAPTGIGRLGGGAPADAAVLP